MVKEKSYYNFRVVKKITLPDDTQHWVLTLDGKDRYTLPEAYYTSYGIKEGGHLRCRVDKINCSGKIFLEPEHPFYEEGEVYEFTLIREVFFLDGAGNRMRNMELAGCHGDHQHHLEPEGCHLFSVGDILQARILNIKKGKLQLLLIHSEASLTMQAGEAYPFLIIDDSDARHWVIQGPYGIKALLEKRHYLHHGLSVGSSFTGYFYHWQERGMPLIEPEHPVYQPGKEYFFQVQSLEESDPLDDIRGAVLRVTDCFGHQIKVFQNETQLIEDETKTRVRCRVIRLKRGIPVLRAL